MGAGASVSAEDRQVFDSNHEVVKTKLQGYKQGSVKPNNEDVGLNNAIYELSQLCDREEYRSLLTDPSVDLPHHLLDIIQIFLPLYDVNSKNFIIAHSIISLWYLSRGSQNRKLFGTKEYGLVKVLAPVITKKDPKHEKLEYYLFSIIVNIVNAPSSIPYVFSEEVGLLRFYVQQCYDLPDDVIAFRMLANAMGAVDSDEGFQLMVDSKACFAVIQRLLKVDVNINWGEYDGKLEYWCLNYAMRFAKYRDASKIFRELNSLPYFLNLLQVQHNAIEGLKVACLLSFVLGKEESVESSKSLLQQYPMVLDLMLLVFKATLKENTGPEAEELKSKRFVFAIITMETIVGALLHLSISDANKASLIECDVLSLILSVLQRFVDNAPPLQSRNSQSFLQYAGGGGEDLRTAEYGLDFLLQLSFYFQTDEELQKHYLQPKYSNLSTILQSCIEHVKISAETKKNISSLIRKLETKEKARIVEVVESQQSRKHVMISYAWAANKSYVIALSNQLRQLGYDVWRDEEGSSIVGPMSGDTDDVMADAIQHAEAVIICVSPQYKESINCRSEAKYCKARQFQTKNLELIYVMMNENYHTRSEPFCVDGWLGFMIGTELWFPLWNEGVIDSTIQSIGKRLGNRAKLAPGASLLTASSVKVTSDINNPTYHSALTSVKKEKNLGEAWECIRGKNKSKYLQTMTTFLDELGLEIAEDLQEMDDEQLDLLALLLKPIPRKQFLSAMAR